MNPVKQRLYRLTVPEAILDPPISWMGEGFCGATIEQQFTQFTYPLPGASEVKMFYRYGGAFLATMTDTNRWVRMYQSPKLEFVVNQDCWWSTETGLADVILPACTNLERDDISEWASSGGYSAHASGSANHRVIVYQQKCVEPVGESKADYDIFVELAERLGVKEEFTEGNTFEEWIRKMFDYSDLPDYISYEDFKEKGYFVVPQVEDYKATPSLRWFYEGRPCDTPDEGNPRKGTDRADELATPSGKVEFVAQTLLERYARRRRAAAAPALHPELGGAHVGAGGQVPAPAHLAPPALLLPHAARHARAVALGDPGAPDGQGRVRLSGRARAPRTTRRPGASGTATS